MRALRVLMITARADYGGGPEHLYRLIAALPADIQPFSLALTLILVSQLRISITFTNARLSRDRIVRAEARNTKFLSSNPS
jgi:hypothetical protein